MADFQSLGQKVKKAREMGISDADLDAWLSQAGTDLATLNASGFGPDSTPAKEPASQGQSFLQGLGQGGSFGFGDEIGAALGATVGRPGGGEVAGDTWTDRYANARDEIRGKLGHIKASNPKTYLAGEVTGAVVPAVIAPEMYGSKLIADAPTRLAMANRSGLVAAAASGLNSLGRAEGDPVDQAKDTAFGAALGYPLGFVSPTVTEALMKGGGALVDKAKGLFSTPAAPKAASEVAKEAGSAAYTEFDDLGVILKPEAMQRLIGTAKKDLAEWGIDDMLQPGASRALQRLSESGDENITMKGVELLRRIAGRVSNPQNPSDEQAATKIIDHIDDFMEGLGPEDILQGNADEALAVLKEARASWTAFKKAQLVEQAITRAEDRAATGGTGGNLVNAVRQNLRQILDNPKKSRGFTAEELKAIRDVVRGGPIENLARLASTFAPSRGGANAWLALFAQSIPGGSAIPVLGEAANTFARKSVLNEANQLPQMILSRSPAAIPQPAPYSEAMARALGLQVPGTGLAGSAFANALSRPTGQTQ